MDRHPTTSRLLHTLLNPLPWGKRPFDGLFALALLVFVALKIPYLQLPFYWDESWSYAPALHLMAERDLPSLLPGAIPPENYRGHPLFFYFLGGCWLKVFGLSKLSFHVFALCISLAAFGALYLLGRRFFSPTVGFLAVVTCMVQSIFFVQAAMVLPEMAVMGLVLAAFYGLFQLMVRKEIGLSDLISFQEKRAKV
jgi:4-amino-4-deoxy-L-arabinose transferase-like glycosyltransferase